MAEKKKALVLALRPAYEELREFNMPEDKFKKFLMLFGKTLVPKFPDDALLEIINDIVK